MVRALVAAAAILCSFSATAEDKPNRVERTVERAAQGTERTAKRAGKFVAKTATRAGKFVERTATKAGKAVKRAVEKLPRAGGGFRHEDRKSTPLNSSHGYTSYAVFCLKKK